jgi:hypothetical protein
MTIKAIFTDGCFYDNQGDIHRRLRASIAYRVE